MTDAARTRWTDERVDDLARRVEMRLDHVVGEIGELRQDVRELRRWLVNLWATVGLGIAGLLVEIAIR